PAGPDTVDMKYITESQYTIAAVENATSYLWDLTPANAGMITGSGLTANVVWNFDFLGDAFIKANAVNECGESEWSVEKQTFVENTVGIVSKPVCDLVVYPNPVCGDKIVISFCYKMERIDIFDMKGITLISKQAESENYSLTHQLPSGVYFIKMVYSDGIIVKKIVVE
ncbi:MAG: T9SS type A sorting domain-containing protein, partial [Bacteroidales bacterium]